MTASVSCLLDVAEKQIYDAATLHAGSYALVWARRTQSIAGICTCSAVLMLRALIEEVEQLSIDSAITPQLHALTKPIQSAVDCQQLQLQSSRVFQRALQQLLSNDIEVINRRQ